MGEVELSGGSVERRRAREHDWEGSSSALLLLVFHNELVCAAHYDDCAQSQMDAIVEGDVLRTQSFADVINGAALKLEIEGDSVYDDIGLSISHSNSEDENGSGESDPVEEFSDEGGDRVTKGDDGHVEREAMEVSDMEVSDVEGMDGVDNGGGGGGGGGGGKEAEEEVEELQPPVKRRKLIPQVDGGNDDEEDDEDEGVSGEHGPERGTCWESGSYDYSHYGEEEGDESIVKQLHFGMECEEREDGGGDTYLSPLVAVAEEEEEEEEEEEDEWDRDVSPTPPPSALTPVLAAATPPCTAATAPYAEEGRSREAVMRLLRGQREHEESTLHAPPPPPPPPPSSSSFASGFPHSAVSQVLSVGTAMEVEHRRNVYEEVRPLRSGRDRTRQEQVEMEERIRRRQRQRQQKERFERELKERRRREAESATKKKKLRETVARLERNRRRRVSRRMPNWSVWREGCAAFRSYERNKEEQNSQFAVVGETLSPL